MGWLAYRRLPAIIVAFAVVACSESAEDPTMPATDATIGDSPYKVSTRAEMLQAEPAASASLTSGAIESRIRRVEHGLRASYQGSGRSAMSLSDRMAHYNVPGVSIAVVDDHRVEWARGYGVSTAGRNERVTPDTLFQAASIGKVVVAAAALHYVDQGLLELDGDVSRNLSSWRLPEEGFTAREKVTLRRLLSHSAGVTVSGFRGYADGEQTPSLRQVMDGRLPANSPPIRVDTIPGTQYRYSGGGYMVVQQLLMDVTGAPFPDVMRDVVLDPWGMAVSTFESPLPEGSWAIAASGHRSDGAVIPGGWHTYPEMGAGASMWATPSDLARFAIGVMRAYEGLSDGVISQAMATQMLTPQIEDRGLGPALGDDGGDRLYFLHPGANEGYRCGLVAYPKRGQAVVIMTNGDGGEALWREILRSVSTEYGWVSDHTYTYVAISAAILAAIVGLWSLR
ncbi:beta-lactamase family protein [Candidatus Poribacteria bacterium]|nr:beta-lactamase family protein [Candidatus Poribacteria bacterium]